MTMMPLQDDTDEQRSSDLHGTTSSKCVFDSDAMFTLYTFMIGFALPAILITMFYSRVICKVQQSSRNMRGMRTIPEQGKRDISAHRVQQVTKRIVAVILFYFLCWTPQWTLNIMTQFNLIHVSWMTPALSAMFFVAHLLVCFNSAANPVLYALINRELRQQHVMAMARKRQSFTHATHGALEFVARHTHKCAPGHHLIPQQATAGLALVLFAPDCGLLICCALAVTSLFCTENNVLAISKTKSIKSQHSDQKGEIRVVFPMEISAKIWAGRLKGLPNVVADFRGPTVQMALKDLEKIRCGGYVGRVGKFSRTSQFTPRRSCNVYSAIVMLVVNFDILTRGDESLESTEVRQQAQTWTTLVPPSSNFRYSTPRKFNPCNIIFLECSSDVGTSSTRLFLEQDVDDRDAFEGQVNVPCRLVINFMLSVLPTYRAFGSCRLSTIDRLQLIVNFAKSTEGIICCCKRRISGNKTEYPMAAYD
ncbi:hypothetical protein ANCDUO_04984 [Ancylostoma duodenale]|uniref:G-protein coupled receptors family 1 profile domain-containing protein n=1 Tax=Ancylostoma duodenale TaxID=51022 RepID=A0A0C2GZQ2_9BILA|nr:hypothetical protein ANCDUO_04984 [Ancylostoma duodenale]